MRGNYLSTTARAGAGCEHRLQRIPVSGYPLLACRHLSSRGGMEKRC